MKKKLLPFIAGMATMALIGGLSVSALAASGAMTITVDPVNVQVNGTTFAPKDAQGNSVPVFSYNGTTYAPLRALAEAYGLDVGYDSKNNMATVSSEAASTETPTPSPSQAPDNTASTDYSDWTAEEETEYQEFRGLWEIKPREIGSFDRFICVDGSTQALITFLQNHSELQLISYIRRIAVENFDAVSSGSNVVLYQFCGTDANDYLWYGMCYADGLKADDFNYTEVLKRLTK